ncbi:MAG: SpoIID/LytB domain-containing protein [Chloroflexi bacterium]|nr:SpoIID/LytB domain-containing protein [Chloroflexota bacterium]
MDRRTFLKKALLKGAAGLGVGLSLNEAGHLWEAAAEVFSRDSGIAGQVVDLLSEQPLAGVRLSAEPSGEAALSDERGYYYFRLPPGTYKVMANAPGYLELWYAQQRVIRETITRLDLALLPANPTPEEQALIYDKVVRAPQLPTRLGLDWETLLRPSLEVLTTAIPSTINVRFPDGHIETMELDEYLKGVVPNEMPANWPTEALRAQAVAARSYAIAYAAQKGYICTDTNCQYYSNKRDPRTSAAVDQTHNMVATYKDNVIWAFYFASCNGYRTRNSEDAIYWQTCQPAGWRRLDYCRSVPCLHDPVVKRDSAGNILNKCGDEGKGAGYYGHGVGMCQWGALARSNEGLSYKGILTHYYTGINVLNAGILPPAPLSPANNAWLPAGQPLTLSWSSGGSSYYVEMQSTASSNKWTSGWISTASWTTNSPPAGVYQWRVRARDTSGIESDWSEMMTLVLTQNPYRIRFPSIYNKGPINTW